MQIPLNDIDKITYQLGHMLITLNTGHEIAIMNDDIGVRIDFGDDHDDNPNDDVYLII